MNGKNILPIEFGWSSYQSQDSSPQDSKHRHEIIYNYLNQQHGIPHDFDWIAYRSLSSDLSHIISYQDAVKHYKTHGITQARAYKYPTQSELNLEPQINYELGKLDPTLIAGIPLDFDWLAYRSLNSDLSHLANIKDAVRHYRDHGKNQSRPYKFDPQPIKVSSIDSNLMNTELLKLTGFNESTYGFLNLSNGLPQDFDWLGYRQCNPDLGQIKCYQDAMKHYKESGQQEGRGYKINHKVNLPSTQSSNVILAPVPPEFNWVAYKSLNSDLNHLKTYQETVRHYQEHGYKQSRPYQFLINSESCVIPPVHKIKQNYDFVTYQPILPKIPTRQTLLKPVNLVTLPPDFNWMAYKSLNSDLKHLTSYQDAIKHYKEHGYQQSRPYKFVNSNSDVPEFGTLPVTTFLPQNFNWLAYKTLSPDLSHLKNYQEAVQHYFEHGHKQNRQYQFPPNSNATEIKPISKPPARIQLAPTLSNQLTSVSQPIQLSMIKPVIKPYVKTQIPKDFDWIAYKCLNPDLNHFQTPNEAISHYLEHGFRESRIYTGDVPNRHLYQTTPLQQIKAPEPIKLTNYRLPGINSNIVSTGLKSTTQIPNIIHFVYGFKKQTIELELFLYIAMISAITINQPDKTYFHYKYEPFGYYWDLIKPYLTLTPVEPPTEIFGNKLEHFAHQADVVRLRVLNEIGGIYLDIDTICLRPFQDFMNYEFVMGIQGANYGLCNAVMMAKPHTQFGLKWYDSYRSFRGTDKLHWDEHSVILPLELSKTYPSVTVLTNDTWFYPLWDPMPDILFNSNLNLDECRRIFSNSYCIHLWESFMHGKTLKQLSPQSIQSEPTLYNLMARKYLKNQISIVMLTFNRSVKTIECLSSFFDVVKQRSDIVEFIILDNHSEEAPIIEFLKGLPEISSKFRVIWSPENLGVCGGRIQLFKESQGDIIFSVDSDLSLLDARFFDICLKHLNNESIGMVGASGAYFSKSFEFQSHQDVVEADTEMYVDQLAGCCQVFRRDLVNFGVQLDPNYGKFWVEDADFCFQITNLGKKLRLIPQKGLVNHTWGGSGNGIAGLFQKNWEYFRNKWKNHKHLCSLQ